jgi:beta-galactosidase
MKKLGFSLLFILAASSAFAATQRESFDYDWKFARFGKLPGGSVLAEPSTRNNKPWATAKQMTTGAVATLEVTADGSDLSYLTIRALDKDGHLVPRTRLPVAITATGPIDLLGICNGDPTDHTPMKPAEPAKASIQVFNGLAQIVIRSRRHQAGSGSVRVTSTQTKPSKVNITTL